MPAKSKAQQSAFAVALAARKGTIPKENLRGAAKQLFNDRTLSNDQLSHFAETKRDTVPRKIGSQIHRRAKAM